MAQDNGKLSWSSLVIGTLLLIIVVVIFSNLVQNSYILTWLIGLLIMIGGVIQLLFRRTAKKLVGINTKLILIDGIIDLIFGILVVFNVGASSVFFVFMFAFWFIFSLAIGLSILSQQHQLRGLSIIVNTLGIILGIILLFNPMMDIILVSTSTAFTLAVLGVAYIIDGLA